MIVNVANGRLTPLKNSGTKVLLKKLRGNKFYNPYNAGVFIVINSINYWYRDAFGYYMHISLKILLQ